ncbi:MAG: TldD/PmbA family protein [Myxococcales bacterium]|nr:TldD/PmbA family protein [Myxococcota bacterium]MDW8283436.1 TldD/PmbA family protein [Myxococcales bacterium]
MPLSDAQARQILDAALAAARRVDAGAESVVTLHGGRQGHTRFGRNEITTAGEVDEVTVTIAIQRARRRAAASTNQTDPASLRATAEAAGRMVQLAPEDPEVLPVLGPQRYAKVEAHDPAVARLSPADRSAAVAQVIALAESAGLQVAGFLGHSETVLAVATSAGLRALHRETRLSFSVTARTPDGTGSGRAAAISHALRDVDPVALGRKAVERAQRSRRPARLEPGRYTVVLEEEAVGDLLAFLTMSLDARSADEGRSFFTRAGGGNRLGERLFPEHITLRADPSNRQTPAAPFDAEGLPLAPLVIIERGVLRTLLYSRFWAQRQGRQPTGEPRVYHLLGGTATPSDLIAGVRRGVLISRLWYLRWLEPQSLLVTGLTRDGVFLIEDGQIAGPVNNFRFNDSPVNMLRNADALSRDTLRTEGTAGHLRVPALRTHDFHLSSISEAI